MGNRRSPRLDGQEVARLKKLHHLEQRLFSRGIRLIGGVDEAGRGPLAGPVVAAAVVVRDLLYLPGLNDSKLVTPHRRASLAQEIKLRVVAWGIGVVPVGWIERYNIHRASLLAMRRAVEHLKVRPDYLLVDGCWAVPGLDLPQAPVTRGDARSAVIAAASILAKTYRDAIMSYYGELYPAYDFKHNKGYPTSAHRQALARFGPCFIHRRTFRGVRKP